MSPLTTGVAVAVLLAGAAACTRRGAWRSPRSLDAARRRMMPSTSATTSMSVGESLAARRAGTWVAAKWGDGLATIDATPTSVVVRASTTAGLMFAGVAAALTTVATVGSGPLPLWWFALPPMAAVAAVTIVVQDVSRRIDSKRRTVRATATEFVQLVAVGLAGDQSAEEAVRFALSVADARGTSVISQEVRAAPLRGIPLWEAVDEVGQRFGVRELCEFATSLERQSTQGVAIGDTALSLAVSMRQRALDDLERAADRANANLAGPTVGFVIATVVFLAYPLAQRITDAFGG